MRVMKVFIATIAISCSVIALGGALSAGSSYARQTGTVKQTGKTETKAVNLLTNPGVETGSGVVPDAWQQGAEVTGVTYIWHASAGYKSKRSLCLKKAENRFFPIAQWFQAVPNKSSAKHLTVSAYVRAEEVRKATLDVQFLSADGRMLSHKWAAYIGPKASEDPAMNHDWKLYSDTVDIPEGTAQIVVAPQIYGPGTVWFDEISALPAP